MPRPCGRDERGQALSSLVAVVLAALFLVAGLVVDGGAKAAAKTRAESVAAHAARAAADAGAAKRATGASVDIGQVAAAGQRVLADRDVSGRVSVEGGVVRVTTSASARTVFLGVLGIRELMVSGEATASLRS